MPIFISDHDSAPSIRERFILTYVIIVFLDPARTIGRNNSFDAFLP